MRGLIIKYILRNSADHARLAKDEPILMTIRSSHYCEIARWCLDRKGIKYTEFAYLPVCHAPGVSRARIKAGVKGRSTPLMLLPKSIFKSVEGIDPDVGQLSKDDQEVVVLDSSFKILKWTNHTIDEEWERILDTELGPIIRRLGYSAAFSNRAALTRMMDVGTFAERWSWYLLQTPFTSIMASGLQFEDSTYLPPWYTGEARASESDLPTYEKDLKRLKEIFAEANKKLAEKPYLAGNEINGDDIAFAALVGPLFCLENFGGLFRDECTRFQWEDFPDTLGTELRQLFETPAGSLVVRLYESNRL